jgi:hypothetical protein
MKKSEIKFIVSQARQHLKECVANELASGEWDESWTPDSVIDLHLKPMARRKSLDKSEILSRILFSVQNRRDANQVISGSVVGGWSRLREMLLDFDPAAILNEWDSDKALFRFVKRSTEIKGKKRANAKARWPQFCKSVISSSTFMERFGSGAAFLH